MKVWIAQQKALERRPDRLYTYGAGRNTLFGSLVHQDANVVDWEISWSLTPAQYEAELISRKKLGFRPHSPTAHEDEAGALRFSVIWLRFPLAAAVH